MMTRYGIAAGLGFAVTMAAAIASGQAVTSSRLPGDRGRPGDGLPMTGPPPGPRPVDQLALSVPIDVAIQLARAAVGACSGSRVGVAVIDAAGLPKLSYVADGASAAHTYTALRKAYTALTFKRATSQVGAWARTDTRMAQRIAADGNLLAWAGGLPIISKGQVIGAIGVSGAEPSEKDEACASAALARWRP